MTLTAQVEAILFQAGEPVKLSRLAKLLNLSVPAVAAVVTELKAALQTRGLTIIQNNEEVTLATAPEAGALLTQIAKEELAGPLGRAGLETAAIILYHGPITRPEIDWIRGVNSSFSIRQLLIRGLIKRESKPGDARTYVYEPTTELLATLGLTAREELPHYAEIIKRTTEALATFNQNDQA